MVDTWTSDAKEAHVIKRLVVGETYTLREEFAPYGYLKATDIKFTVEDTGKVQHVEMKDEQIGIFERYCKFLNSLDCNYKITINNKNKNMDELRDKVLIAEKNDGFNNYRRIYNDIIEEKIIEGRQGIEQERYLTITIARKNFEYSAKYLQQLWKKVRKQGGLCTGITQNVVDLLQNYTATTMLANSEFVALLKQANTDSSKMAEVIGVSEAQLRFVTNTVSGMGLIKCGSVVIPFDNQISKDTDLYRLYNTNIHEKIAMMKKQALD